VSAFRTVLAKELRETVRDRRTLLIMVVVPVLLYPALMIISEQLALFGLRRLGAEPAQVALVNAPPEIRDYLSQVDDLEVQPSGVIDPVGALRDDSVGAVAVFGDTDEYSQPVRVMYDGANDRSSRARAELTRALRAWGDTVLARRLGERGLPDAFAAPVSVSDSSVARPAEVGGNALGRFLPMLLIVITLLGTFYPAIDLAAGEKERGTLETLLTAPVPSHQIVMGKFLTVAIVGVLAAALNLASMYLTFQTGIFQLTRGTDFEFTLPFSSVLAIFALLIPLAVLFGSVFLGIAVTSRSFKEAQNALTPVYMLALVPALLPVFPGIESTPLLAMVPIAGVALFFRDLMGGDAALVPALLAIVSTVAYAGLALAFAARAFGREDILFGAGGEATPGPRNLQELVARYRSGAGRTGRAPGLGQALGFIAAVAILFFYLGRNWQVRFLERGLFLSEWLLLLVPALLFVLFWRFDVRQTLSLRKPGGRALLGGVLLMAGGTPLAWFLAWLQSFVLPIPWELVEGLTDLLTADSGFHLLWLFVLISFTPAVCEEMVFRGVLLGGSRRLSAWTAIVINGAVFGAFHLSFESAFRFLPTAFIGTLMAFAVWHSRSIFVSMLMHMINNGVIVLLIAVPVLSEWLGGSGASTRPPLILLPPALLLAGLGAWMLLDEGKAKAQQARLSAAGTTPASIDSH